MTTHYPTRRTGLGRRVADIVRGPEGEADVAPGGLLSGPAVVPLDLVPFPMLVADSAGRVLAANQRWTRLTGLSVAQSLGSGWLAALAATDRAPLRSLVQGAADGAPIRCADFPLAGAGSQRVGWWLAAQERAGERLVGIAVGEPAAPRRPPRPAPPPSAPTAAAPTAGRDPVLEELPALLLSVRGLLDTLDLLVERLPCPEEIPA